MQTFAFIKKLYFRFDVSRKWEMRRKNNLSNYKHSGNINFDVGNFLNLTAEMYLGVDVDAGSFYYIDFTQLQQLHLLYTK